MNIQRKIEKQQRDLTKKRNKELIPVAKELIKLVAETSLPLGDIQESDHLQYKYFAKEILAVLLRNNVRYTDRHFIFQLILQPFDVLKGLVIKSLEESFSLAVDKKFGKDIENFRLEDLDRILKESQL